MLELAAMAFLALAWLVPNHYPPWSSFYNESCAALGLVLLVLATRRSWFADKAPALFWVVAATAAIPALQLACGLLDYSGDAWVSGLYLLGFATAIAAGYFWTLRDSRNAAALLAAAAVVGSLISSILALAMNFQIEGLGLYVMDASSATRQIANLGQPNNLATLIGIGVLGVMLLYEQRRIGSAATSLMVLVLLIGAALTQSRTALLFGPIVLLGYLFFAKRHVPLRTRPWAIAAAVIVQWLLAWAWPALQNVLLLDATTSLAQRSAGSSRFQVWPILIDAMSQAPWWGYGWLQVGAAELARVDRYPSVGELYMHGHNLFLELVIWCGYPLGLLLGVGILCWYVSRLLRVASVEAAAGMLVVSIFGLHAMLELPHHYAYFLIPVGLWIGQVEFAVGARGLLPARWNLVPAVLACVLLLAIWRDYVAVEDDFRLMRFERLRIGTARAAQPAPDAPFLSSLTAFLRFTRTVPVAGMSTEQLASMEALVKRYPYAPAMMQYASALALNGRLPEARQMFIKIKHIHGEGQYLRLKRDLHDRIAEGQPGLLPLEQSLPP